MEIGNGKKEGIFLSWCHWALGKINYSFAVIFFLSWESLSNATLCLQQCPEAMAEEIHSVPQQMIRLYRGNQFKAQTITYEQIIINDPN